MIKEIKKNRLCLELIRNIKSSQFVKVGNSSVLISKRGWVIDNDHMIKTIFVYKELLIKMIGYDVEDDIIKISVNSALNNGYKVKIIYYD